MLKITAITTQILIFSFSSTLCLADPSIIERFRSEENSTGNIADAVETVTGERGWMNPDMKPLFDTKIVGQAVTALMKPGLKNDKRTYTPYHLEILDEARPGSVLVYVMEDALEIAAIGNLMTTTAQIRGLEGIVIDGAARDIAAIKKMQFPVFTRAVSPATSVGRMIPVGKQIPVKCGGVMVRPGDYIIGDPDGVVVVPQDSAEEVLALLTEYDDKESKMMPIIKREKSILKAIEIYKRY